MVVFNTPPLFTPHFMVEARKPFLLLNCLVYRSMSSNRKKNRGLCLTTSRLGGGGEIGKYVLYMYLNKKSPKINSGGWQHTRVDNKEALSRSLPPNPSSLMIKRSNLPSFMKSRPSPLFITATCGVWGKIENEELIRPWYYIYKQSKWYHYVSCRRGT